MMKTCGTASSLFADAIYSLRTRPAWHDWREALYLLAVLTIFATVLGTSAGLFTFAPTADWLGLITIALAAILVPSLAEEMVFRVILAGRRGSWRAAAAIGLFVLWHPAQVWLGLPMAQPIFLDPAFLAIAAGLGLACTISWRRSGSIWPPVAIHWAVVVMWKGLAGG